MKNIFILSFLCFLFWEAKFPEKSKNQKIIDEIRTAYQNADTFYETGTFEGFEIREDGSKAVASNGKHELFLDNKSKKMLLKYELKFPFEKMNKDGFNVIYSDNVHKGFKEKNLILGNSENQDDILIHINRHAPMFFFIYPEHEHFSRHILDINIYPNTTIINDLCDNIACHKLTKKYTKNINKEQAEKDEKENQMLFDSLGKPELADRFLPKIIGDTNVVTETYWFRKSDKLLIKMQVSIVMNTTQGSINCIFNNTFSPKVNKKIDKRVFQE